MYKIINHPNGLKFFEFYNQNNFHVILSNYGASIYQIDTNDLKGNLENVVMSPPMAHYYKNTKYFGLTVGRVAGRIEGGTFKINNHTYSIPTNENNNLLHSGKDTFAYKYFDFDIVDEEDYTKITYKIFVKDMEDGFPGDLELEVIYVLYKKIDGIDLEYKAISSKDTFLNITNHSYFNLSGNLKRTVVDQILSINKFKRALMDENLIIEKLVNVEKEYDFRKEMPIGTYLNSKVILSSPAGGYDDVYTDKNLSKLSLYDEISGRVLNIESNYPDLLIYTNNIPQNIIYPSRVIDEPFLGIAIEPSRLTYVLRPTSYLQKSHALYNYYIKYRFSLNGGENAREDNW